MRSLIVKIKSDCKLSKQEILSLFSPFPAVTPYLLQYSSPEQTLASNKPAKNLDANNATLGGNLFSPINNNLLLLTEEDLSQNLEQLQNSTQPQNLKQLAVLVGSVAEVNLAELKALSVVDEIFPIENKYPLIARHNFDNVKNKNQPQLDNFGFSYNSVEFSQNNLNICAGFNTVDSKENVVKLMRCLQEFGLTCTRMGIFKPRTSPHSFQGLGAKCLPYVFEQAHKYGIKVIAMEVTSERHIAEIHELLTKMNHPTGVMLQIGTRNTQNFELLKAVGKQTEFPILLKRGYGITLEESLLAAEYLAAAGNSKIVFCLRGVKSIFANPQRNLADFSQIAAIKRLTKLPVCIDPSHSVGNLETDLEQIPDIFHAAAQGVISGANMLLMDVHPEPNAALVDSKQTIALKNLPWLLEDIALTREAYLKRVTLKQHLALEM